jgi:hypothetical protein
VDFKRPEWQSAFETGRWAQRMQTGLMRAVIALFIPVSAGFFISTRLGLVLAVPFGFAFCWLVARSVRRFTKREF